MKKIVSIISIFAIILSATQFVLADYSDNSKTTVHNVVYALFRTFKESPIGDAGQLVPKDKTMFVRTSYESLERETVVYSLYKYCERKGCRN